MVISTQLIEGHDPRLEVDDAELEVVAGPDKGLRHQLSLRSFLIGADPGCELVLHDPTVSARHAEVVATSQGYALRDLGSANGVLANGKIAVERAPLVAGVKWHLGKTVIVARTLGTRTSVPLEQPGQLGEIVAHSVKMRAVVAQMKQLAASDITVLLEGETGTGKEVACAAIHASGPRAGNPLVVFDCSAVSSSLIAGELFGHERGAFTGADIERPGVLEQADGGTVFLDEIGELPLEVQPMLLGAIERKAAQRVGGSGLLHYDVRFIAATHRNLEEEVRLGRFRKDLLYRLAVARIHLPPLRERREDILVLADLFAAEAGATLSPEVRALLLSHSWPGNVRELHNAIERLAIDPRANPALAGPSPRSLAHADGERVRPLADARRIANEQFEREYLELLWERSGRNLGRAAELAGTARQHLGRMLDRYGIRPYQ